MNKTQDLVGWHKQSWIMPISGQSQAVDYDSYKPVESRSRISVFKL